MKVLQKCYNKDEIIKRKLRERWLYRMKYSVKNIAEFVIWYCSSKLFPISNLKLQNIHYLVWRDYYNETLQELYPENIYAWKIGPVVPEVYYDYCQYGGNPIDISYKRKIELKITNKDEKILEK